MKRRTPQQKKIDTYVRDGRNAVAESRSIAHKAISKRKAWVNKSYRKSTKQVLEAHVDLTEENQLVAESSMLGVKRHFWRKYPDIPLVDFMEDRHRYQGKADQQGKKDELRSIAKRKVKARFGKVRYE